MYKNLCPEGLGVSGRESEVIELALSHGFKGLDLDLQDFAEQVKTAGFAKASRLLVSARLKLGSFRLPVRWQEDSTEAKADLAMLPALLELASQLGCTRAITTIEPGSDERPFHQNFEYHRRRLQELGELLAAKQMRLGVEFLAPLECRAHHAFQFMQRADEVMLLLGSVGSPHVGLALDTFHWHLGSGTIDQLRLLGPQKIVTVAIGDADPALSAADAKMSDCRLPYDGGAVDNAAILSALAEMRYDGPVTPKADKSQFEGQSRQQIVKAAAAAFDSAWKSAGLNPAGKMATVGGR
jgi:sugar phosphate isomerase/epimerase